VWGTCGEEEAVKYIGYSDFFGRGNNRRVWLLHMLCLAHLTGRTLVLPDEYTFLSLRIFNFSRVTELADVVTSFDFFWDKHPGGEATMVCLQRPCFFRPGYLMPLERDSYAREFVDNFRFIDSREWQTIEQAKTAMDLPDTFIDVNLGITGRVRG